jgi:hypothetical protein
MKKGRIIPPVTYETAGELHRGPGGTPVDVEYQLWVTGPDDAGGSVRIGDDPVPGHRFMGDPASVFSGNQICVLETGTGHRVHVFFTDAAGRFRCCDTGEAKDAVAAGG